MNTGAVPAVAVSLLPDGLYQPLVAASSITVANLNNSTSRRSAQTSVASSYLSLATFGANNTVFDSYSFSPMSAPDSAFEPTSAWRGNSVFLLLPRERCGGGASAILTSQAGPLVQANTTAAIGPIGLDWGLYDLGTYSLRASEYPQANVEVQATLTTVNASAALDVGAFNAPRCQYVVLSADADRPESVRLAADRRRVMGRNAVSLDEHLRHR